jgi:CHAD domain-containing protein
LNREGLSRASGSLEAADLHAFRIQTKRLRYRTELAADLGDGEAEAALASLKILQDELGRWHDQTELAKLAAEALSDPEFLIQHPRSAATILRKMDRDHALQIDLVRQLLATTHQAVQDSAVHAWIERYCGEPPGQTVQQPDLAVSVLDASCASPVR